MAYDYREQLVADMEPAQLTSLAALATALDRELDPDEPETTTDWAKVRYAEGHESCRFRHFLATEGDHVVGIAEAEFDLSGSNDELLFTMVNVHPDHRRSGVGKHLFGLCLAAGKEHGATTVATWGVDSPEQHGFCGSLGLEAKYSEAESTVSMADLDRELMERWMAGGNAARAAGYSMVGWRGPCPDQYLDQLVKVLVGMNDAPLDDLEMNHTEFDHRVVRNRENFWLAVDSVPWALMILAPDGEPAAFTEVLIHGRRPHEGQQQSTTTLPQYRGQGLGRWIKAAMALDIVNDAPQVQHLTTENAESNDAMLKINIEMGFEADTTWVAHQAKISGILS